jgi:isoleucyl-tRNA synthetase
VIAAIDSVNWIPAWSRDRIRNMTETRPDWCLSRQRAWGVPIPALRCSGCGEVGLYDEVMANAQRLFALEGSDAWFARPVADFVTPTTKCARCGGAAFTKEEDVLDVWFDSGVSQAAVLAARPELQWPADAYLEAVEQARGWFGSSLACAVAERDGAPFRSVISHGLTVDEQGRKMSKSLGNSEDAADVVERLGADVVRLVYASLDYTAEIALGPTVYAAVAEAYRKIRNTCRFMLGNLFDFDPSRDAVGPEQMLEFDRFILARFEKLKAGVRRSYEAFDFQAAYHALLNFVVVDLSSLYIDVARDRLYCDGPNSRGRRSAQTALYLMLDALVRILAPLIPFTADEIYLAIPGHTATSVHLLTIPPADPRFADDALEARWELLLAARQQALKVLEAMRQAGTIGAPLEARLSLGVAAPDTALGQALHHCGDALKDLFIVSSVALLQEAESARLAAQANGSESFQLDGRFGRVADEGPMLVLGERAPGVKCQRCWCYFDDGGSPDLCPRCRQVVAALAAPASA